MESAINRLKRFEKAAGQRHTQEREAIVRAVFESEGHFRVDDLLGRLKEKGCKVSRATVYRTIPLLLWSGIIREAARTASEIYYEHAFRHRHHDHLVCEFCGRTVEFYDEEIETLQVSVAEKYDFELTGHVLELLGICGKCKGDAKSSTSSG